MSIEPGLIEAIAEQPHDDAPRLIYADWLEEAGRDAEAELIRLQLALPTLAPERLAAAKVRERRLVGEVEAARGARHPEFATVLCTYERGLIAGTLWADAATLIEQGEAFSRLTPQFRAGFVRIGARDLRKLASSPVRPVLAGLDLGHEGHGPALAEALAEGPVWPRLVTLDFDGSGLGDAGLHELVRSANFPKLQVLGLARCRIGPQGAQSLAASPHFANLKRLDLGRNRLEKPGVAAIANSERLQALEVLILNEIGLTLDAALSLANASGLPQLRRLEVFRNRLSPVAHFALRRLRERELIVGIEKGTD